jgi:hypothetical protein
MLNLLFLLNVIMLSVVMLNVIMRNVVFAECFGALKRQTPTTS